MQVIFKLQLWQNYRYIFLLFIYKKKIDLKKCFLEKINNV